MWLSDLDDSVDSGNFSVRGYLPLIQKDSTHMDGLAVYVKEGLFFSQSQIYMVFSHNNYNNCAM